MIQTLQQLPNNNNNNNDNDELKKPQELGVEKKEEEKDDLSNSIIHHNVKLIIDLQSIPEYENTLASILSTDGMIYECDDLNGCFS